MRRRIKSALGWLAYRSGLYRRSLAGRAVIVLFHRVDDRYGGNPISCTTAEYRAFLAFFARYFTVIPLAELLERLRTGADVSGRLVITFDDGYLDNHRVAAPLLAQHRMPATFYIATDFIGTTRVPWWDRDAGIASEWMSWDDVRALHRSGFAIGAHTKNHVDLGVVAGDEAAAEIAGSRERLERELGATVDDFTYPYGRPQQITEANRDLVREAGFRSMASAFGGDVVAGDEAFRLLRTPISPWHRSPWQLGWELLAAPPAWMRKVATHGHTASNDANDVRLT